METQGQGPGEGGIPFAPREIPVPVCQDQSQIAHPGPTSLRNFRRSMNCRLKVHFSDGLSRVVRNHSSEQTTSPTSPESPRARNKHPLTSIIIWKACLQRGKKHRQEKLLLTPGMGCRNSLEETKSIICELVTGIFTGTAKLSHTSNRSFRTTIKEIQHC